jgi:hypothetical protein
VAFFLAVYGFLCSRKIRELTVGFCGIYAIIFLIGLGKVFEAFDGK